MASFNHCVIVFSAPPTHTHPQGLAADWAREKLETEAFSPQLERICLKGNKEAVGVAMTRCACWRPCMGCIGLAWAAHGATGNVFMAP